MATIHLPDLPFPGVIETLNFETIRAELIADLQARLPEWSAALESDPVVKLLEVAAYREVILRARINDAARAVMLAYAVGSDLDHIAALFGVTRQVIDPGDPDAVPPVAPTLEADDRLRTRTQLSIEGYTVAGPRGAYLFHALSASPLVKDVDVYSPSPGEVVLTVLSTQGDGTPDAPLLAAVLAACNADTVRPLTDHVTVQAPTLQSYALAATIHTYEGPDAELVRAAAEAAVTAYVQAHHLLGHDIPLSGLYAALHQPGVQRVEIATPAAGLVIGAQEAAWCTGVTVTLGGVDV